MASLRLLLSLALIATANACYGQGDIESKSPAESTAPYAIGSMTRFFHDEARGFDTVGGSRSGVRVLPTEIWYPVSREEIKTSHRRATQGDYVFGDKVMFRRMATDAGLVLESARDGITQPQIDEFIELLFSKHRNSYFQMPVSNVHAPFPVVIMSHGDHGQRFNLESTAEHLAAHGYIVLVPDHPGNASFALTGRDPALKSDLDFAKKMEAVIALHDEYGAYFPVESESSGTIDLKEMKRIDAAMIQRVNDLRTILDALQILNDEGNLKGAINLEQIGVMGRSLGAATTLSALGLERRFKAGVAVVSPSVPDFRKMIPKELLAPAGEESVMFSSDAGFPLAELTRPTFLINCAEDALIITMAKRLSQAFGTTNPSEENPHPVLRAAYEKCELPVAWSMLENGNHGTLQVAGPYWWPELKRNRFPRFFAPDTNYTLEPPDKAHRFQAERVLAFFDLVLKEDATALQRLLNGNDQGSDRRATMLVEGSNLEKAISN
jgi:dienelactone hydrolase